MEYLEYLIEKRNATCCYREWRRLQEIIDGQWLLVGMKPTPFSADDLIFENVKRELRDES